MKKVVIIAVLLIIYFSTSAQVISFVTDSEKDYSDSTRTSYLTINGYIPDDARLIIEQEIISHPDVSNFSFYDNTNLMKCMFTSNASIDEKQIVEMINDIISDYSQLNPDQNIQQIVYRIDDNSFKFKISGIQNDEYKQKIIGELRLNEKVLSVDINLQNMCKMVVTKETDIQFVEKLFSELGLEITEITKN